MRKGLAGRLVDWIGGRLAAECRWPWPGGLRLSDRLAVAAIAGSAFVLCFYALVDLATLFDQGDQVSLFFPVAGLCLLFGYLLGPSYLLVPIVGVLSIDAWASLSPAALAEASLHIVRQALLYGAAGVLLRARLGRGRPLGTVQQVGVLLVIATVAVLANLGVALLLFAQEGWLARADIPTVALVFFLGDLSGLLLVVPPALLLLERLLERRRREPRFARPRGWPSALALVLVAAAFVVLTLTALPGDASLPVAATPALLPILGGAMLFGYAAGVTLFSLAAAVLLAVSALVADPPSALSLQTVLVVCSVATLMVSAATSDRTRLIARLNASVVERTRQIDAKNASLIKINAELQVAATTDHLTRLPNRRAFDLALEQRLAEQAGGLGLLMIDVDRFKQINDRHGHQVGDAALTHVARLLTATIRSGDFLARVGGEEFAVVSRSVDERQLHELADRLRRAVRAAPLRCSEAGDRVELRVSVGGALAGPGDDRDRLLRAADRALYAAKRAGRDRTRIDASPDRLPLTESTA